MRFLFTPSRLLSSAVRVFLLFLSSPLSAVRNALNLSEQRAISWIPLKSSSTSADIVGNEIDRKTVSPEARDKCVSFLFSLSLSPSRRQNNGANRARARRGTDGACRGLVIPIRSNWTYLRAVIVQDRPGASARMVSIVQRCNSVYPISSSTESARPKFVLCEGAAARRFCRHAFRSTSFRAR